MTIRARSAGIALTVLIGVAAACAPQVPPAGGLVGLGEHSGQIANASVYYQYDGVAGEQLNVGLMLTQIDFFFSEAGVNLAVYAPDNSHPPTLRPLTCGVNTCTASYQLPVDGRYTIALEATNPLMTTVRTFWLTLSHDEFMGPVPFEAPIPAPVLGQVLSYNYAGTAGESLNSFVATVLDPGGNTVLDGTGNATLPTTGTYTIVIRGHGAVLSHDIVGGSVALGENVTQPLLSGQRQTYTYAATAGETLGFFTEGARLELLDPSSTAVLSTTGLPRRAVLSATGTYQILVTNLLYSTSTIHVWVSHDVDGGVVTPGVVQAPLLDPGQSVAYRYAGVAGETLQVSATKSLPGVGPEVMLFAPDGTELASSRPSVTSVLTVSGTHLVVVLPNRQDPNVTVTVTSTP